MGPGQAAVRGPLVPVVRRHPTDGKEAHHEPEDEAFHRDPILQGRAVSAAGRT
jgi:hypothetical protein